MERLWFDRPAAQWQEALPIGNGRLGAMIFGGTRRERRKGGTIPRPECASRPGRTQGFQSR